MVAIPDQPAIKVVKSTKRLDLSSKKSMQKVWIAITFYKEVTKVKPKYPLKLTSVQKAVATSAIC
jgi:hypothetical protein